jgi:hypothetical protein
VRSRLAATAWQCRWVDVGGVVVFVVVVFVVVVFVVVVFVVFVVVVFVVVFGVVVSFVVVAVVVFFAFFAFVVPRLASSSSVLSWKSSFSPSFNLIIPRGM